ncbi:MAG: hypothetical protein LBI42_03745 [Chitinispirillales bacterium]|nr:hypothetical protein [Chitinispirillales bacterium]
MNKVLALVLAAGCVAGSYATDARVDVMGRHDAFFRDEISVFRNPADMSLYPNMLYGSYGWVDKEKNQIYVSQRGNLTLSDPFFGAMFSHKLGEGDNAPMLSIGAFVNRRDRLVQSLLEASGEVRGAYIGGTQELKGYNLKDPVGKLDLMFGYDLGNGIALGFGLYGAHQKVQENDDIMNQSGVYKITAGINWNLDQGLDFEASFNGGSMVGRYRTTDKTTENYDPAGSYIKKVCDGDYFYRGDVRFFSAVPSINGAFVPQVSMEHMKLNKSEIIDVTGGIGLNMNIDRGFFWAGLQGLYTQMDKDGSADHESIGGRISFGIERNIVWDWFLIRVGGEKEFRYVNDDKNKSSKWVEYNKENFDDEDGLVGLGFGINIDNRLRIDFVSTNDVAYTFTNLISGPQLSLFRKISATYRF